MSRLGARHRGGRARPAWNRFRVFRREWVEFGRQYQTRAGSGTVGCWIPSFRRVHGKPVPVWDCAKLHSRVEAIVDLFPAGPRELTWFAAACAGRRRVM
ncbi:MAG: hypothetical protein ACE15F_06050 [bacterium]